MRVKVTDFDSHAHLETLVSNETRLEGLTFNANRRRVLEAVPETAYKRSPGRAVQTVILAKPKCKERMTPPRRKS